MTLADAEVYEWIESHYGSLMTERLLAEHKRLLLRVGTRFNDADAGFMPDALDKILQTVKHARACIAAGHEPLEALGVKRYQEGGE